MKTKILLLLVVICLTPSILPAQDPFDVDEFDENSTSRKSFSSWDSTQNSWIRKKGEAKPLAGVQPNEDVLAELQVKWQPVTVDELGEHATVRGQLVQRKETDTALLPIDWQQGVTVVIGRHSLTAQNTTESLSLLANHSEIVTCITDECGNFEAKIELRDLTRDKEKEQTFRGALALAIHRNRKDSGPIIVWSSEHKPLKNSYVDLVVPPNPAIDPVTEAIHLACVNDFDPRSMIIAVNTLQPLGKEAALQRLEAYVMVREKINQGDADADAIFWILRLLFEPIELGNRVPVPMAFINSVRSDVEFDWPLNPIVVADDIPFRFIGGGGFFSGIPEPPSSHIQFVRRHCVIRDAPLHPNRDPILIAEQLIKSPLVSKMHEHEREAAIRDIRNQAFLLLPAERLAEFSTGEDDEDWHAIVERSQTSPLVWSMPKGFQEARE